MSECRPPEGTPDGAWCVLERINQNRPEMIEHWQWREHGRRRRWHSRSGQYMPPGLAGARGYRFISIATPPEAKP